jgi:MFS family permease
MLIGGAGGGYLYGLNVRYPALLAGVMACLSCLCFWVLINNIDNTSPLWWIVVVAVSTGLTSGTTGPIVKATLQNVSHPQARGQAFALLNTFDDFGRGVGPYFVASLITSMNGDRQRAFNVGAVGWMICGFLNAGMFCTVKRDEDVVQQRILLENRAAESRVDRDDEEEEDRHANVVGDENESS